MTRAIAEHTWAGEQASRGWHLCNCASWYLCDEPSLHIVQSAQVNDQPGCAVEAPRQGLVDPRGKSSKAT